MNPRVCIIGLDCADPRLLFDRFADDLPTLTSLRESGLWGPLHSCHPPITIPAWPVMMSGRDPGALGIYGFRNRKDFSYEGLSISTSLDVRVPRLWDLLNEPDDHSIVVGVPGTYPPPAIQGDLVSGFLAPGTDSRYTHPSGLVEEIKGVVDDYEIDVRNFRTEEKERLLEDIRSMTRKRFRLFRHLLKTRPWNLAILVEIGLDRIHHGFWRYFDSAHRFYELGNRHETSILDYYRLLDREIGETIESDPRTTVLIVSDHGAQPLKGGFAINEWLIREGYLVLKENAFAGMESAERIQLQPDMIDWSRTRAWGEGGYFGRLFLNIEGREPQGIVGPAEVDSLIAELEEKLSKLPDDQGRPMGNTIFKPAQLFREVTGIPPDLMVYFGDLAWRSIGSIDPGGSGSFYTPENDTGPDDANHDWEGVVIAAGGPFSLPGAQGRQVRCDILDIAPTVLNLLNRSIPASMRGTPLVSPGDRHSP